MLTDVAKFGWTTFSYFIEASRAPKDGRLVACLKKESSIILLLESSVLKLTIQVQKLDISTVGRQPKR